MVTASMKTTVVTLFYYFLFNRRVEMNIRSVNRKHSFSLLPYLAFEREFESN